MSEIEIDGELRSLFEAYRRGGAWEDSHRGEKFTEWQHDTENKIVAEIARRLESAEEGAR